MSTRVLVVLLTMAFAGHAAAGSIFKTGRQMGSDPIYPDLRTTRRVGMTLLLAGSPAI